VITRNSVLAHSNRWSDGNGSRVLFKCRFVNFAYRDWRRQLWNIGAIPIFQVTSEPHKLVTLDSVWLPIPRTNIQYLSLFIA